MLKTKDIVVGLGEIGNPILKLISKATIAIGYDINPKLADNKKLKKYQQIQTGRHDWGRNGLKTDLPKAQYFFDEQSLPAHHVVGS
mgnify:CR=1 FL=1